MSLIFTLPSSDPRPNQAQIRNRLAAHLQDARPQGVQDVGEGPHRPQVGPPHHRLTGLRVRRRPPPRAALPHHRPRDQSARAREPLRLREAVEGDEQEAAEGLQEDVRAGVRLQDQAVLAGRRHVQEVEGRVRVEHVPQEEGLSGRRGELGLGCNAGK